MLRNRDVFPLALKNLYLQTKESSGLSKDVHFDKLVKLTFLSSGPAADLPFDRSFLFSALGSVGAYLWIEHHVHLNYEKIESIMESSLKEAELI